MISGYQGPDRGQPRSGPSGLRLTWSLVRRQRNWWAIAASLWAACFAAVRGYWLFGGDALRPSGWSGRGLQHALSFLALAALLLAVATGVRLAAGRYRGWLFAAGATAAGLMFWHAALDYGAVGVRALLGQRPDSGDRLVLLVYEPYWLLGGALWTLAVLAFRRARAGVGGEAAQEVVEVAVDLAGQSGLDRLGRERGPDGVLGKPRDPTDTVSAAGVEAE